MKANTRQSFCAFTKFQKMAKTLRPELNITNKGMRLLQTNTDHLILQYIRLLQTTQTTKTLRAKHITFLLKCLQLMGVHEPSYEQCGPFYSARMGHHVVKRVNPTYRIGKDAPNEVYKLYLTCLNELLVVLRGETVDIKKRLTPDTISKMLEHSKLSHAMA